MMHKILAGAAALGVTLAQPLAAGDLSYFTWAGYELPEFHEAFLAAHPGGVDITSFADDNDALSKVRSGFHPDVAHPCTFKIDQWKAAGLLQPIDISRITNWKDVIPALKTLPGVVDPDGTVWMVPWDWGNTSVIYRTDLVDENTDSWALLWDKKYAGRIAALDASDTPIIAAMMAGVDPFKASDADLEKIGETLRAQFPLLRFYSADQASIGQALASGELVAAMAWNAAMPALRDMGSPVAFMKPKEGMLTWTCGMVLMKDAQNIDAAYDLMNARLTPELQAHLISEYGYGGSLTTAYKGFSPEQLEAMSLPADPAAALADTTMMQPQQNGDAIMEMFETVKAGG